MIIWTIVCTRDKKYSQVDTSVVKSCPRLSIAEDELAFHIANRIEQVSDFAYAVWNDENHPELRDRILGSEKVSKTGVKEDWIRSYFGRGGYREVEPMPRALRDVVIGYVMEEVRGNGCYYVYSSPNGEDDSYHFDIIGNELE